MPRYFPMYSKSMHYTLMHGFWIHVKTGIVILHVWCAFGWFLLKQTYLVTHQVTLVQWHTWSLEPSVVTLRFFTQKSITNLSLNRLKKQIVPYISAFVLNIKPLIKLVYFATCLPAYGGRARFHVFYKCLNFSGNWYIGKTCSVDAIAFFYREMIPRLAFIGISGFQMNILFNSSTSKRCRFRRKPL